MARYILETDLPLSDSERAEVESLVVNKPGRVLATLKPQARTLHIVGRRWFQKSFGNTYHTAEVVIDGKTVHKTARAYGYGDQYLTSAHEWLIASGHLPEREERRNGSRGLGHTLYLREESGFDFTYECHDVARERDL